MGNCHSDLQIALTELHAAENKIADIIRSQGLRFSVNKITGDLGEYYAKVNLLGKVDLFESIITNFNSNDDCDMLGVLSENSFLKQYFNFEDIRIEVKTRRAQEGVKYLGGVKPHKFDLLVVVDISKDYSLNNIFLVTSKTADQYLDKKRGRLIFKDSMAFLKI